MGKILQFDASQKIPQTTDRGTRYDCDHKEVIAYTLYRTVRCNICGTELDPFDVLVDMLKGYVPQGENDLEEKRLLKEVERRNQGALQGPAHKK